MKMNKPLIVLLSSLFLLGAAGCDGSSKENGGGGNGGGHENNTDPVISGVEFSKELYLNDVWDALEGISAYDEEDGNLTNSISVTVDPSDLPVSNGVVTATTAGDYLVTYSVTDSDGAEVEEFTDLRVNNTTEDASVYHTYSFTEHWKGRGALVKKTEEGLKVFTSVDKNAPTITKTLGHLEEGKYQAILTLVSDYSFDVEVAVGSVKQTVSLVAGEEKTVTLSFELDVAEDKDLVITTPNEDKSLLIKKLNLKKEGQADVVRETAFGVGGYATRLDNGAAATLVSGEGWVGIDISSYPGGGAGWALGFAKATELTVSGGVHYELKINLDAKYTQHYEFMVQPNVWGPDSDRTGYKSGTLNPGLNELTLDFTAEKDVKNAFFEFYMGIDSRATGETENQLIKLTKFELTIPADYVNVFDEVYSGVPSWISVENYNGGEGTAKVQNEKLVYTITSFAANDYDNKVQFKGLNLKDIGTYRVTFSIESSEDVHFNFFVNTPSWRDRPFLEQFNVQSNDLENTYSFDFDFMEASATDLNLYFQFGGNSVAPCDITISNVAIYVC